MTIFVVDPGHTVHVKGCPHATEQAVPYRTGPETPADMVRHIDRPDGTGGMMGAKHSGPSRLWACDKCVRAMAASDG